MCVSEVSALAQHQVTEWEIPYWDMERKEQFAFVCQGLQVCGCADLIVDTAPFVSFFDHLREGYRSTNIYHNFDHAMQTFHCAVLYLVEAFPENVERRWPLSEMERLALFVAALGHDIDHRGRNNNFEIASQSELALLYNDFSVLEMHHCAVLTGLLREHFFLTECEDQRYFRQLLVKAVLGTDMALHGQHVKTAELLSNVTSWDESNVDIRLTAVELLVHAADIGAQTLPPVTANVFGDRVMAEFTQQAEMELTMGIPVTPYMQGLQPENRMARGTSQLGFIDYVVAPFWNALARPFPLLTTPMVHVKVNRETFMDWIDESKKALKRNAPESPPATSKSPNV